VTSRGRPASATEVEIEQIRALAEAAGIARLWRDAEGVEHAVADDALAIVLDALGYPAETSAEIIRSLDLLAEEQQSLPALLVTEIGRPTALPGGYFRAELVGEDGAGRSLDLEGSTLPAIDEPGYYHLVVGGKEVTVAVAPKTCHAITDLGDRRLWGPSIQISALRGKDALPYGHLGHLDEAVRLFAARGADAVMINPMHALLPFTGYDFSPYSPSSKLFLNGELGDPALVGLPPLPARDGGELIDWTTALPQRLADLRVLFDGLDEAQRASIAEDNRKGGEALSRQAIFDALDLRFRAGGAVGWQQWPREFQDPDSDAVKRFADEAPEAIAFHMFVQWLAREGLAAVQKTAKGSGMAIGLLADLAVGVRPSGSDNWAGRKNMLSGLSIGAPPDPLGPLGQDWTLTTFSPRALKQTGFSPFIEMLRSTLSWAGGLRIDHAFGLKRLWVVPEGGESRNGAYLAYPFETLLRLTTLESHRAKGLVVAEDLGTKPAGFAKTLSEKAMLGMRVLWFERAMDHGFIGPQDYEPMSVAMTGTHDTPTVAGWWRGTDLDWAEKFDRLPKDSNRDREEERRAWDRGLLWATFGEPGPRPAADDPAPAVEAALHHIGRSASQLAIAPLEDLFAIEDQFNLPGVVGVYPSWRRRLAAPLAELLDDPENARRIEVLAEARGSVPRAADAQTVADGAVD
jgi:4-alpha-glucanotransferase